MIVQSADSKKGEKIGVNNIFFEKILHINKKILPLHTHLNQIQTTLIH